MGMREYMLNKKQDIKNLTIVPRIYKARLTKDFINSIVGPRRAGKTYFLFHLILNQLKLQDKDYLFINFEEESITNLDRTEIINCLKYHQELYGTLPTYIFLDEIQNLENWRNWIYELYEKKKFYIFLTGSTSKLLSKEISTELRGRLINLPIFPFNFREILSVNNVKTKKYYSSYEKGKLLNILRTYINSGGFPQIVLDKIDKNIFFRDYIDVVMYRDIVDRYKVKEPSIIRTLIKFMASSFSSEFSIHKVYRTLKSHEYKVSQRTLYLYFDYINSTFISFPLKKFSYSEKKSELSIPKIYLIDTGLINYLLPTRASKNLRSLMENIVFLELKKKELYGEISSLFYLKSNNDYEVDFLIKQGLEVKELIQVTYASDFDEINPREYRVLIKASELFKQAKLTIITWDYENQKRLSWFGREALINFVPLWKWLLEISFK